MEKILPELPSSRIIDEIFEKNKRIIEEGRKDIASGKEDRGFFQEIMSSISTVSEAEKEAREKSVKLILGETEDIHDVMIAREKAEVLFQLFLEIRNRAVQAFENIMRAQF